MLGFLDIENLSEETINHRAPRCFISHWWIAANQNPVANIDPCDWFATIVDAVLLRRLGELGMFIKPTVG
jgi:hypothetical protein